MFALRICPHPRGVVNMFSLLHGFGILYVSAMFEATFPAALAPWLSGWHAPVTSCHMAWPHGSKWLKDLPISIKNQMGPFQRTPQQVTRAIRYSGLGVHSVGPVGDFLDKTEYDRFFALLFWHPDFFPYGHFGGLHICHKNIQVGRDLGGQKGQWLDFVGCFFGPFQTTRKKHVPG